MKKLLLKLNTYSKNFWLWLILFITQPALAEPPSLGGLASNITDVIGSLSSVLTAIAFIIGVGFGVGAIIKYKAHRDNPQQIGLNIVITLLVLSIAFLGLGILSLLIGYGLFSSAPQSGGYYGTDTF